MKDWELVAHLPSTLPTAEIEAAYELAPRSTSSFYEWNGWEFTAPPGVFIPGPASRLIHDRLLDGRIQVADLRCAAMGVGLGVEAVIAGTRGAAVVYGIDIHEASVRTTASHYSRIVGDGGPPLIALVSDLWREFPTDAQLDVVTFNPPFIDICLSEDADIVRNRCMGAALARRFFAELVDRRILAPAGVVYLTLANTEPIRTIVTTALHTGLEVEAVHCERTPGTRIETHLLVLRERLSPGGQ